MEVLFAIVFFIAAFVCIAVEVFIIPGFGVAGILGLVLLTAAVAYAWITLGTFCGIGMLALSALVFAVGVWIISKTRFGRRFVLKTSQKGAVSAIGHDHADLVGKEGTTESDLHPVGTALIDGRKVDVVTEGVFIKKGGRIRVVETDGPRIVVESVKDRENTD